MVIIDTPPPFPEGWNPNGTWIYPSKKNIPIIEERHVKEVKKGIMIKFDDGTWMFMATDDECYVKIKDVLDGN